MNVLLLTSHSIAEHDDLDMFTRMGVPTFSIGAYTNPQQPSDDKRPALLHAPHFPELEAACNEQRARHAKDPANQVIDWAKGDLPPEVIDWADTVICHHFPEAWIGGNWERIRDKRVIWRTCGQSDPRLELAMCEYVDDGLQVVRYSPREREVFYDLGAFAGEDAMIRFGKDPLEWHGWRGDVEVVGNVTQHMMQRGDACGYPFWSEATEALPTRPAGPGSDALPGGIGALRYDDMREYLRSIRAYLYTGTRPASYTLGLLEALMTGVPVVSVGPEAFGMTLLEPLSLLVAESAGQAAAMLEDLLADYALAADTSMMQRIRTLHQFGLDGVMDDWAAFLGVEDVAA